MITAFFRTVLLYALLIVGLRLTGKRQMGQLEPIEFVLMMLLSDLASVPMQYFGLPLLGKLAGCQIIMGLFPQHVLVVAGILVAQLAGLL